MVDGVAIVHLDICLNMWSLLRERTLWKGITGLALLGFVAYLVFNYWIMPQYTRHGVTVSVPDAENLAYEQAARVLEQQNLQTEKVLQRFNPELPRDVVVDQQPRANRSVKPGRRVYLTVNSGETPYYKVPDLIHLSRRQAINQIEATQLEVGEIRVDSIPSPYKNTVTRQEPAPEDSVQQGTEIDLWVSPGQGDRFLEVPQLTGRYLREADSLLRTNNLQILIMTDTSEVEQKDSLKVTRQYPQAGENVREGSEIRVTADTTQVEISTDRSDRPDF
jgi:beta-lactam-binding protein with PASTA domain